MGSTKKEKIKVVTFPVINLHLEPVKKEALEFEANKRGIPTTSLVRMLVLEFLDKCGKQN